MEDGMARELQQLLAKKRSQMDADAATAKALEDAKQADIDLFNDQVDKSYFPALQEVAAQVQATGFFSRVGVSSPSERTGAKVATAKSITFSVGPGEDSQGSTAMHINFSGGTVQFSFTSPPESKALRHRESPVPFRDCSGRILQEAALRLARVVFGPG